MTVLWDVMCACLVVDVVISIVRVAPAPSLDEEWGVSSPLCFRAPGAQMREHMVGRSCAWARFRTRLSGANRMLIIVSMCSARVIGGHVARVDA